MVFRACASWVSSDPVFDCKVSICRIRSSRLLTGMASHQSGGPMTSAGGPWTSGCFSTTGLAAGGMPVTLPPGAGVSGAGFPSIPPPWVTIGVPDGPVGTVPVDAGASGGVPPSGITSRRGRTIPPVLSFGRATAGYRRGLTPRPVASGVTGAHRPGPRRGRGHAVVMRLACQRLVPEVRRKGAYLGTQSPTYRGDPRS